MACDRDGNSLAIARRAWDAAGVGHKARSCSSTLTPSIHVFMRGVRESTALGLTVFLAV